MQISKRLGAIAGLVTPVMKIADIGTDHAYLPIWLTKAGVIQGAIAADIHQGPLLRAQENIRSHGLEDKIETRLSDGLDAFAPGEVQSIVMAGMGGALTVRILDKALAQGQLTGSPELILQPQSEIAGVRIWLEKNGWKIRREEMVFEDGKYYPMMKAIAVCFSGEAPLTQAELAFGPDLLRRRHPVLRQYLLYEERLQRRILESLQSGNSEAGRNREREVRARLALLADAQRQAGADMQAQRLPEGYAACSSQKGRYIV